MNNDPSLIRADGADLVPSPDADLDAHGTPPSAPRAPRVPRASRRALARQWRSTIVGVALAVGVVVVLGRVGFVDDYGNTLQVMGFDPDRAVLLTSLLMGAIASVVVGVAGGWLPAAVLTGAGVMLVSFAHVFRTETVGAIRSKGPDGTFDPIGWVLSSITLITFALLAGWAAGVLGRDVAARLVAVRKAVGALQPGRTGHRRAGLTVVSALGVIVLVAVTTPIFGDMLNFDPDAHLRVGAPAGVSLFGGNQDGGAGTSSVPAASPGNASSGGPVASTAASPRSSGPRHTTTPSSPLVIPADLVPGPVPGSYVTAGALGSGHPWTGSAPSGGGRTLSINLPAPWTGGLRDYSTIDIYLPPGYDAGSQRYPVVYEPHQPLWAWDRSIHVTSLLDSLIRAGDFPPEIVVFVGQYGGPYADSECADSFDQREWFDRYLGVDVPSYVDAHFRTIATPAARSLLGFSSGGYCAAAAITHHPDVFSTAMIFSGYFETGIQTSTTPVAGRPFNNDPALEARVSPMLVVPGIARSVRSQLFLTFSADPQNRFYGDQITAFSNVLDANGVSIGILPTPLGHSWAAVREQLPGMLSLLASRQVLLGVFK
jgi:hypothetical protein